MKTQYLHRLLIVMIIATALALLLHRYGMDAVFRIDGNSNFIANAVDDRDSGGKTQSTLRRENGKLILECQVDTSYQWPYCEIAIGLKQPPAGMDLSRYDFVRLKIRYEGPEDQHQVRFFLRNFHPAYAKVGDATSLKVQELVYDPSFRGKLISSANFRLGIIAVWLLVMIGYLVADAVLTHRQLSASTRQQASLKRINEALRVQTLIYAKLSRHDTLTGVLNPKGLGDELFELAKQREEDIFPMSLVFVDIDHFRKINDQYSHSAGDQVLKNLSNVIRDHIKPSDLLARWGGEEFLVVCPGMSAAEAGDLAESLRNTVSSRIWPNGIRVTCSFGLSELAAGEDLGDGIKRASDALQRAKENGRDRVEAELAKVA
ncbi:MAG: hypothetical protein K0S28_1999 [Paucimonas sp.]|nr:hypothetical protein [Paucimonas sp.]